MKNRNYDGYDWEDEMGDWSEEDDYCRGHDVENNFRKDFVQKCEKDIKWLESGKIFSPKCLYRMLTFYIKGYKKKFAEQIEFDNHKFVFENAASKVKDVIKTYISKDWVLKLLLPKGSKTIEVKNHNEEIVKIIMPKIILNKIGGDLFEDLCKEIEFVEDSSASEGYWNLTGCICN